jgi:hypothetical protein
MTDAVTVALIAAIPATIVGNNILDGPESKGEDMDTVTGQQNLDVNPEEPPEPLTGSPDCTGESKRPDSGCRSSSGGAQELIECLIADK